MKLLVSDNGVGMDEEVLQRINERLRCNDEYNQRSTVDTKPQKTGIALKNVNDRIRLCYGVDYGITVHSTKYLGTDVMTIIPKVREHE